MEEMEQDTIMGFKRSGILKLEYKPTIESLFLLRILIQIWEAGCPTISVGEISYMSINYSTVMEYILWAIKYSEEEYRRSLRELINLGLIRTDTTLTLHSTCVCITDLAKLYYVGETY